MSVTFEQLQVSGLQPSLLANKLKIPQKNLTLLFAKIRRLENGCWEWTAAKVKGYGVIKIRAVRQSFLQVHRLTYQLVNGPISEDVHLHHKVEEGCIGPSCCNPAHLQETNLVEHVMDLSPASIAFVAANRNCCAAGHSYAGGNLRELPNGWRQCKTCDRLRKQAARDAARGDRPKFKKQILATHCKRGHALEGDNLYFYDTPWGKQRRCRKCQELRNAKSRGKVVESSSR